MIYRVKWKDAWIALTKFMSIAISVPVFIMFMYTFFVTGMRLDITFEHVAIFQLPIIIISIITFSAAFAFFIALFLKTSTITIKNGVMTGKNYWGFKNSIPVSDISKLYHFNNNGIKAIVASAGDHGKVYISTHTEKLSELIEFINKNSGVTL